MKKLLITGAEGFVGRHAIDYALRERPNTMVYACSRGKEVGNANKLVQWIRADMLDAGALDDAIKTLQPDAVLHLAAASSVGYSWQEPRDSTLNNLNIYLNLLEAVRHHAPSARVLSVGSSEVYGQTMPESLPLNEHSPLRPASPYAVARASQEALSKVYAEGYGLDIVMTRSFNHFGPGQGDRFALPSFARQIARAKNVGKKCAVLQTGNLDIIRDFTDVRDVVRAYFALLDKGVTGNVYNVCSGTGRSLRDIVQTMASIADIAIDCQTLPSLIRLSDLQVIYGDCSKIRQDIGWTPHIEFSTTIQDVMEEWRVHESSF